MTVDATLAYIHFVAVFGTAALVLAEHVLCRPGIGAREALRLRNLDAVYFGFAIGALLSGGARVLWGAKGADDYVGNPVFFAKLGVFLVVGLLSLVPTFRFFAWVRASKVDVGFQPPAQEIKRVQLFLRFEILLIFFLPVFGVMLARGLGFG